MDLKEALKELDVTNDDHWTANGAPDVQIIKDLTRNHTITRQNIAELYPMFSRTNQFKEAIVEAEVKLEAKAEPTDKERLQSLRDELEVLDKDLDAMKEKRISLFRETAKLTVATAESTAERRARETQERQAYIRKQGEIRLKKHEESAKVLEAAGLSITNKSALDQAMARKTNRGTQRPVVPFKR